MADRLDAWQSELLELRSCFDQWDLGLCDDPERKEAILKWSEEVNDLLNTVDCVRMGMSIRGVPVKLDDHDALFKKVFRDFAACSAYMEPRMNTARDLERTTKRRKVEPAVDVTDVDALGTSSSSTLRHNGNDCDDADE